jgi:hypothetical protein
MLILDFGNMDSVCAKSCLKGWLVFASGGFEIFKSKGRIYKLAF